MTYFKRFINAAVIIVLLCGVAAYVFDMQSRDATPARDTTSMLTFDATASNAAPASTQTLIQPPVQPLVQPLDKPTFDTILASSHKMPVFLMVYAAWCPHCKVMFPQLNALQEHYKGNIRIVTFSIDNRREQAEAFIKTITPLHVETYGIKDAASYAAIGNALRALGLKFQGGTNGGVSVPYNTVIYKGKPIAEIAGAIPAKNLASMMDDIVTNTK